MTITIGTIQTAYMRLWRAFQDAAEAQHLGANASETLGAIVSQGEGKPVASATILLRGWPYRAVATKKRTVDIAVQVREEFSRDLSHVVRAGTRVGYFSRDEDESSKTIRSQPLLEIHYDFETPVQDAHPMFHAQIGEVDWPEDKLRKLGLEPIDRSRTARHFNNARVPTAFVGFAAILVSLAADHLKPERFRDMMKAVRKDDAGVVDPACGDFSANMLIAGVPHGHHWYDHRYAIRLDYDKRTRMHMATILVSKQALSDRDEGKLREKVAKALRVGVKDLHVLQCDA